MSVAVIVVAAGSGTRLGLPTPKAFVNLGGATLLEVAISSISRAKDVAQIVAVVPDDLRDIAQEIVGGVLTAPTVSSDSFINWQVVAGGVTRHESVAHGLAALSPDIDVVLVHDAARALTPPYVFDDVANTVRSSGLGVVPSLPVVDTVKQIDAGGEVVNDIDRASLAIMQTPQGFPRSELATAYSAATHIEFTDDASVFRAAGFRVLTIPGDAASFKITTPDDLSRAQTLFAQSNRIGPVLRVGGDDETSGSASDDADSAFRIGTGVDTHAFSDDATVQLHLAGLVWPGERGLSGHSDGDAVAHAVCDALLAAAGLGDIGSVFGTDDPRFAGATGDVFVTHAVSLVHKAGFDPVNVSVQVVGNRPRMASRRGEAEAILSSWVGAPVSLSATTTDGLGFTGRGEGVAAIATALIRAR